MVKYGIDRIESYAHLFRDKRLGMVTAASAVAGDGCSAFLAFHKSRKQKEPGFALQNRDFSSGRGVAPAVPGKPYCRPCS